MTNLPTILDPEGARQAIHTNGKHAPCKEPEAPAATPSKAVLKELYTLLKKQDHSNVAEFKQWLIELVPQMALLDRADLTMFFIHLNSLKVPKNFCDEALMPLIVDERGDQPADGKQSIKMIKLAREKARFFTGRHDSQLYASVQVEGHIECYRMGSNRFNWWMSKIYYNETGNTIGGQARSDAKDILAGDAQDVWEDVFTRVGHFKEKVYIDLCTAEWNAIEIDADGWRIVPTAPVNFARSAHMSPLVTPVPCPDLLILRKHLNITDEEWPLVAAWMIAAMRARGPFPVLALLSQAGSAKSTALRVFKKLIDPSSAELRAQPVDIRDLYIAASNSWLLAFDNVSHVSSEVSDALCVIATGGGYTKKANYTDGDEYVINVQRPIAINGIGDVLTKADLLDRAILLTTPYISETDRQDETEFWAAFEREKPKILGALLHALSVGLRNIDNVHLERKPRMADFAKIAVAAETAYTDGRHDFLSAYAGNREGSADSLIDNSPVGDVIRRLVPPGEMLTITAEQLLERMNLIAKDYEKVAKAWPSAPNKLKGIIDRLSPALEKIGIRASHKRGNAGRVFTFIRK